MRRPNITRETIKSYLRTRKDNKYYFKFPWMPKGYKTLVCELTGLMQYWKAKDKNEKLNFELMRKDAVFDRAFETYQKKLKELMKFRK